MKTSILFFLILVGLIVPAHAAGLFPDSFTDDLRIVSTMPDLGLAVVQNIRTGLREQVRPGDVVGVEQVIVVRVEKNKIIVDTGSGWTSLRKLPHVEQSPNNRSGAAFGE